MEQKVVCDQEGVKVELSSFMEKKGRPTYSRDFSAFQGVYWAQVEKVYDLCYQYCPTDRATLQQAVTILCEDTSGLRCGNILSQSTAVEQTDQLVANGKERNPVIADDATNNCAFLWVVIADFRCRKS